MKGVCIIDKLMWEFWICSCIKLEKVDSYVKIDKKFCTD